MHLHEPCQNLPHVTPKLAQKLQTCGLHTLQDLLLHLPYRYHDKTKTTLIKDLKPGEYSVVFGQVCKVEMKRGKRPWVLCYIEDKTGVLKLKFFNFYQKQFLALQEAPFIRACGDIHVYANTLEITHPEYQLVTPGDPCPVEASLTPIYPLTSGLAQNKLKRVIHDALDHLQPMIASLEWMSDALIQELGLVPFTKALEYLHRPPPDIAIETLTNGEHPAMKRLIIEELLAHQLSMQFARKHRQALNAPTIMHCHKTHAQFLKNLPFSLTNAQIRAANDIQQDLMQTTPMLRLLQGDVGSGKTVLAGMAALQAMQSGYQTAFMAPTELLTEQHVNTLTPWFDSFDLKLIRLTSQLRSQEKKAALAAIKNHEAHCIIGTHALFQEPVQFSQLGLIIIDEQHRFGVAQRHSLQQKARHHTPHQLLMTATPIPRTLAMSQLAHLDVSTLDELPPGRTPVVTAVTPESHRDAVIERLHHGIQSGRQAYWICTLIEESEVLQNAAATATTQRLKAQLPNARVGLVHGRMKPEEKGATMQAFKQGSLDVLVATTVIEVGVNVPNASLMIIENAERLGLAQLHQLRGRVGRGALKSHCVLLYQPPLSQDGAERLRIIKSTTDGFVIAEKDLQLRGSGEFLGTRQTGYKLYKIADPERDHALLKIAQHLSLQLHQEKNETALLIVQRWLNKAHEYGNA